MPLIAYGLKRLIGQVEELFDRAHTGRLLRDGMTLVIAGLPNASRQPDERADRSGQCDRHHDTGHHPRRAAQTDRDRRSATASSTPRAAWVGDAVEREGVRRARVQLARADHALWVFDGASDPTDASGLPDSPACRRSGRDAGPATRPISPLAPGPAATR